MNKELEKLLEENYTYRDDGGDRVFYDSSVESIAEQYAQSQTEALKKEIEELKAENIEMAKIIEEYRDAQIKRIGDNI